MVDKSLVRVREQGRFWMLETIREYAAEQLDREPNAAQLRRRHAENFVAAAEAETPHLRDDDRHGWMRRLKDDQDNFRRAVAYLEAAEEVEDLAQLLSAVSLVWAPVFEALAWLERALAMLDPQSPVRPRALNAAASLYASQGEPERGAVCAREALDLAQRLGQPIDIAESQWALGFCLVEAGEPDAAPELLRTSVDLFAAAGDLHGAVWAARSRAFALIACGRPEDGRALHEENLARARSIGNRGAEATT